MRYVAIVLSVIFLLATLLIVWSNMGSAATYGDSVIEQLTIALFIACPTVTLVVLVARSNRKTKLRLLFVAIWVAYSCSGRFFARGGPTYFLNYPFFFLLAKPCEVISRVFGFQPPDAAYTALSIAGISVAGFVYSFVVQFFVRIWSRPTSADSPTAVSNPTSAYSGRHKRRPTEIIVLDVTRWLTLFLLPLACLFFGFCILVGLGWGPDYDEYLDYEAYRGNENPMSYEEWGAAQDRAAVKTVTTILIGFPAVGLILAAGGWFFLTANMKIAGKQQDIPPPPQPVPSALIAQKRADKQQESRPPQQPVPSGPIPLSTDLDLAKVSERLAALDGTGAARTLARELREQLLWADIRRDSLTRTTESRLRRWASPRRVDHRTTVVTPIARQLCDILFGFNPGRGD